MRGLELIGSELGNSRKGIGSEDLVTFLLPFFLMLLPKYRHARDPGGLIDESFAPYQRLG